ncbi:hypothetical protein KAH37_09205 [bacterium]|nr:hypothetical protein [bacterium]
MKAKRLIPFSTLFISDISSTQKLDDEPSLYNQIKQWIENSSFNANGVVYLLSRNDEDWLFQTMRVQKGSVQVEKEELGALSFMQLCKRVHNLNPSLSVAIGYSNIVKGLTICSGANYKIGPRSFAGFFLYKKSFPMKTGAFLLSEDVPELFNNAALKSAGYAQTRFLNDFDTFAAAQIEQHRAKKSAARKAKSGGESKTVDDHHESVDLGILQESASQYLLWAPNAKKSKTAFKEFADITFIAESLGVSITAFFRDKKLLQKFSKDFYIKGRKKDFDKYLTIEIGDRDLFERLSLGSHITIFSSSLDSLYRRERKRAGKEKVVTLYSYKKKNPQ